MANIITIEDDSLESLRSPREKAMTKSTMQRELAWCHEIIKVLESQRIAYRRLYLACRCGGNENSHSEINKLDGEIERIYQQPEAKKFRAKYGGNSGAGRKRARPVVHDDDDGDERTYTLNSWGKTRILIYIFVDTP